MIVVREGLYCWIDSLTRSFAGGELDLEAPYEGGCHSEKRRRNHDNQGFSQMVNLSFNVGVTANK